MVTAWRTLHLPRSSRWLEIGAVLLVVAAALPHYLPLLAPSALEALAGGTGELALLAWTMLAAWPRGKATRGGHRRALWLQCAAVGCWLGSSLVSGSTLGDQLGERWELIVDLFYSGFYVFLLLAVEQHAKRLGIEERRADRLATAAFLVRALGLGVYFVGIPLLFDRSEYDTWVPSSLLYVALDLLVAFRCSQAITRDLDRHRQPAHWWLRLAALGWAVTDALDAASLFPGSLVTSAAPSLLDPLWYLPFLPWIIALGHLQEGSESDQVGEPSVARLTIVPRNLVGSTVALLLLHLSLYGAGLLSAATRPIRGRFVLFELLVTGGLALLRERGLQRRRQRLQAETRKSERERALLTSAFEAMPVGLAVALPNGRILRANPALADMFGVPREALHGLAIDELAGQLFAVGEDSPSPQGPRAGRRADGSLFPVQLLSRTVLKSGAAVATVNSFQDVSLRVAAEERLRLSEQQARRLIDSLPDAVLSLDEQGVRYLNPPGRLLLGIDDLAAGAERLASIGVQGAGCSLAELLRELPPLTLTDLTISLDDRSVEVEVVVSSREGPAGSLEVVIRDVSETRRLEDAQERHQRLAEIGRFSRLVAHRVREAQARLEEGAMSLHKRRGDRAEDAESISDLLQAVARLDTIARGILEFSVPLEAERRPVAQHELLHSSIELAAPVLAGRSIELVEKLDESAAMVLASEAQLQQAMTNLFENAAQAMPRGGTIEVHSTVHEDRVEVAVRDSGDGMEPAVLERIFEPFFTTRAAGTGLGLAVVARIVARHGGRITPSSVLGEGSTFTLELPRADGGARPDDPMIR